MTHRPTSRPTTSARRRARRWIAPLAVFVLAVAACGSDDDDTGVATDDGGTTTTTTTTAPAEVPDVIAIWPAPDAEAFATAEDAALDFAREYLGMPEASLADPTVGDAADIVGIRPYPDGGPTTVVEVAEDDGGWVVTGATTEQLVVDEPTRGAPLASPLAVHGEGTANEGTIHLEIRPLGSVESVAFEFTTGDAMGEMGPFEATLAFETDATQAVLVVFAPDASGQAQMLQATVVPLG